MNENREPYSYSFEPVDHDSRMQMNGGNSFTSPEAPKPKKSSQGVKIAAVAVACALVGGAGGSAMTAYLLDQHTTNNTQAQVAAETPAEDENVVVNRVVHTNTGDKNLTPKEVYDMYVDSTVGITTTGTTSNGYWTSEFTASGSGFIISEDGYIVTNHHVIEGANTVQVALYDGTLHDATIIGSDASNDVAVLKIEATGLHPVSIGNSDEVSVGDQAVAIGNPLGTLNFSMTAGYVSALNRDVGTGDVPITMLQTDVAINSGNSGGPLFDMNGNVIGITTAKYSGNTSSGTTIEGLGFAIPINDAMSIVNDLIDYGYVTGQAYLGVGVINMDATTAKYYSLPAGVYVDNVTEGSCADKAGVREADIITALGDQTVESYSDLAAALKDYKAGDTVTLTVYRGGQTVELSVTLDEKQPEPTEETEQTDSATTGPNTQVVPPEEDEPTYGELNPFDYFFGGN